MRKHTILLKPILQIPEKLNCSWENFEINNCDAIDKKVPRVGAIIFNLIVALDRWRFVEHFSKTISLIDWELNTD